MSWRRNSPRMDLPISITSRKKGIGELDFLIETDDGDVLALEIKPGKYYRSHAALDNALNTDATPLTGR